MNILFIIIDITLTGGTERVTALLANTFQEKGHNVSIVSLFKENNSPGFLINKSIKLYYLLPGAYTHDASYLKMAEQYRLGIKGLREHLHSHKYDKIISQTFLPSLFIWLIGYASKVYVCEHFKYEMYNSIIRFFRNNFVYKHFKKIVVLTQNDAEKYVYVPAFLITHKDFADALIKAHKRGADVKIIIDANSTSTRNTKHQVLRQNGIRLKTENYAGKMHMKSIIIDDKYFIAGSMNFSNSGENKNDENMVIVENPALAKKFKEYFLYIWQKIPDIYLKQNARAESPESIGSCNDGVDNDFDGLIDSADPACKYY